jgi:HEAT repeat protein
MPRFPARRDPPCRRPPPRGRGFSTLLALAGVALSLSAPPIRASAPVLGQHAEQDTFAITWARDLDSALQVGLAEYKPVLALFSLPNCGWCSRLKAEFAAPSLRPLLASFVLAEVDASTLNIAQRYGIRGAPTILVFSGDGRILGGFSGFLPAPELKETLAQYVGFAPLDAEANLQDEERFARLAAGTPQPDDWPGLMRQLGDPARRDALRQAILGLNPYPAAQLVSLLGSPDLAVRMGAIELLEERTGEDFGFDPWLPPLDPPAAPLRQRWQDWAAAATNGAASTNAAAEAVYAPLTDARIATYIQDILGEDRMRTVRAMQMLEAGGHHAACQLAAFVQAHPDLAPGLRRRLREVQYAILLHGTAGHQASATAHQIVFGNLDTRIRTVAALPKTGAGIRAIPILQDLLADENPLLREAACEAILGIAGGPGTVLLTPFLKTETDVNVVFSALRALGRTKSPRAVMALLPYLEHPNEDLVIVALEGLAKLKYAAMADPLAARLQDPRWRVRVAALETIAALKIAALREPVSAVISDEDAFVRHAAIGALAATSTPGEFTASATRLFREFPDQRALVIQAMAQHDLEISPVFIEAIADDDDPDRIVACLGAATDLEERALPLAGRLVSNPHPDISAAALAILMKSGVGNAAHRRHIIDAFQTRTGDELAGLLEDLNIESDDFQPYALQFRHWMGPNGVPQTPAASQIALGGLMAILSAFENAGSLPAPIPPPAQTNAPSVEEIIAAFDAAAASASGAPSAAAGPSASFPDLIHALEALASHDHPRVAFLASACLVRLGNAALVPALVDQLTERTQAERGQIVEALGPISTPAAKTANIALLVDASEDVRSTATGNLINNFANAGFVAAVDELLRPGTPLHPSELSLGYRTSKLSASTLRQQGHRLLASDQPPLLALGILLSASGWTEGDADWVLPYVTSDDPYIRAAALRVLGLRAPSKFQPLLSAAVQDPSPAVRGVVADIHMATYSTEDIALSKDETISLRLERKTPYGLPPLDEHARAALHTLAQDSHPPVRFRALLALLTRGETIDATRLASALDSLSDSRRAAYELLNALDNFGGGKPRPELNAIGNAIRKHLENDSYWERKLDKIFGPAMTEEDLLAVNILTRFDTPSAPALIALEIPAAPAAVSNPPPTLLFFYQPGCKECRHVETLLAEMPGYFAHLQIRPFNVRRREAALLNEALCDRFGVPGNARLIAPSVFAADGALIGEAITFDSLADLLSRSAAREDGRWHAPEQTALAEAERSIQHRYGETIKTGVIVLVALADGVNPCAFATIIFLLSYLHIARRGSRQLLQVGGAFILGVFLAYFAMGIGLVTLLDRLAFLGSLSRAVNIALAAFVLLIALLSLRDGVLCLRGRMGDMTLQLPGALKQQIHAVIRHGARHRRFVVAAFVLGALIAVIELPCTGQAYLPTIAYMVRDAQLRANALFHLLLYNVLFVAPLVVIFILAAFGLTHERLAAALARHAAAVKFATAVLFFALFGIFLFTF